MPRKTSLKDVEVTPRHQVPTEQPAPPDESQAQAASGLMEALTDPDIVLHLGNVEQQENDPKLRFLLWSRMSMNGLEKKLWGILGKENNLWRFVPQVEILGYVVDFYSPRHKLAIEADGPTHNGTILYDRKRDKILLEKKYIRTLRFSTEDIENANPQDIFRVVEHFITLEPAQESDNADDAA